MATKKKTKLPDLSGITVPINEKKVVKGSHLTVTTYPDGKTELEWDHDALLRDVQEAISSFEDLVTITEEKVKKTRKKK